MSSDTTRLFGLVGVEQCRRKTFTEALPSIPPRSRLTSRLRTSAGEAIADRGRTVVQAARDFEVSWPVRTPRSRPRLRCRRTSSIAEP
ncbi:helix-turn-helix domain-containing protein [Nonomuraea sp. NPDC002799]